MKASAKLLDDVEDDLKAAGLPPLAWYDALLELRRAGDAGLPPNRLQEEMLLAQYNVSRLIDRLETEGLVERRAVAGDRRRQMVHITQEGRGLLKRMWPVYEKAIGDHFATLYSSEEARALALLLSRAL